MKKLPLILITLAVVLPIVIALSFSTSFSERMSALEQPKIQHVKPSTVEKAPPQKQSSARLKQEVNRRQNVEKTEKRLKKPVVVIDPGHQKVADLEKEYVDTKHTLKKEKQLKSAVGIHSKQKEYEVTLRFSKLLKEQLEKRGYAVSLTRTKNDVTLSNKERAEIANHKKASYVVMLHADGGTYNQRGLYVIAPSLSSTNKERFKKSEALAKSVLRELKKQDIVYGKGLYNRKDLALFNFSKAPAISVQLGFLTNPKDDKKLQNDRYLKELSKWLARGFPSVKNQ